MTLMDQGQIVEFAPEHAGQVIALISRVLRDQKVLPESDEPIRDDDLYHIAENYREPGRFWVYLSGERVLGTVALLESTSSTAQLKCMFVATACHGQGIGQALLDRALDFARARQYSEMILSTHPLMQRAHRFYERNGFARAADIGENHAYLLKL